MVLSYGMYRITLTTRGMCILNLGFSLVNVKYFVLLKYLFKTSHLDNADQRY